MAVEFVPIDEDGRYAVDVDGFPHAIIRLKDGEVKRLIVYSEATNTMPTAALLRAIADKLEELGREEDYD